MFHPQRNWKTTKH